MVKDLERSCLQHLNVLTLGNIVLHKHMVVLFNDIDFHKFSASLKLLILDVKK